MRSRAASLLFVALAAVGGVHGAPYLWVLSDAPESYRGSPVLGLVDPRRGEVVFEHSLQAPGCRAVDAFWLGAEETEAALCVALEQEGERGPVTYLSEVDFPEMRLGRVLHSWPLRFCRLLPLRGRRKAYVQGQDARNANVQRVVQFGHDWRVIRTGDVTWTWAHYATSSDARQLYLTHSRLGADVDAVDAETDKIVHKVKFPGNLWPDDISASTSGPRVLVKGYDEATKQRAILTFAGDAREAFPFGTGALSYLGPFAGKSDNVWVMNLDGNDVGWLELRSAADGGTLERLQVRSRRETGSPDRFVAMGERRVAVLFSGLPQNPRNAGCLLVADAGAARATYVNVTDRRPMAAVLAELSEEEVRRLQATTKESGAKPLRAVRWPTAAQVNEEGRPATAADLKLVRERLSYLLRPRWRPRSLEGTSLDDPSRSRLTDFAHLSYTIASENEIPSWAMRFRWLINLKPSGSPLVCGQMTGSGAWFRALHLTDDEARVGQAAVSHASVALLAWPTTQATSGSAGVEPAPRFSMPIPSEYPGVAPDGTSFSCFERRFKDWLVYSWVERGEDVTIHYQASMAAPPPSP